MTGLIRGLLSLLIAAAAILFALANREDVAITWSPLHPPYDLPVFAVALGALLLGFLLGGLFVWLGQIPMTVKHRRTIKALEKEIKSERSQNTLSTLPSPDQTK